MVATCRTRRVLRNEPTSLVFGATRHTACPMAADYTRRTRDLLSPGSSSPTTHTGPSYAREWRRFGGWEPRDAGFYTGSATLHSSPWRLNPS